MQRNESVFAKLFKWVKRNATIKDEAVVNETSDGYESMRCPQCGNILELQEFGYGFGDPAKWKCTHCQYICFYGEAKILFESDDCEHEIFRPKKSVNYYAPLHGIQNTPKDLQYIPEDIGKKNKNSNKTINNESV